MSGKNKALIFILAALFAAVLMVPFIMQRATVNQLEAENASLSGRVKELTRELAAVQTRTNPTLDASAVLSRNQMNELMRLRAEVTTLRQQSSSPAAASTGRVSRTPPLPVAADPSANAPTNPLPNAPAAQQTSLGPPWRNAGFAQPTDAATTLLFSAQQGGADSIMAAMTPEAQAELQARIAAGNATPETLQQQLQSIPALRPSPNHPNTDNEAFFVVDAPSPLPTANRDPALSAQPPAAPPQQILRFQNVGGRWLYAGGLQ